MIPYESTVLRIKSWWKSLTIWLGVLIITISQVPPEVIAMLHPDMREWAYSAVGLALIYIRIKHTRQAITVAAALKPVASDKVVSDSR